ncbi:type VI secretion system baseplate subunit TssF [Paraflavitalea pollutisoli]|uniref:type VI secretion system baseplate subunit TssF n=1 Tax=Paraflavitalea pollutisoli TaxID=3034143 RepID=UPI0023ED8D65|nr:type VI secretion system baseplate subunit TssF [Paraflavitalea sp. H1-2-19X]
MLPEVNSSKDVIKNRMLRHALTFWNIRQIEDLDPAVKLMLEAMANELYMLGQETRDAQVRILEKIAGLLAPDSLTAPAPAHALLHAMPTEATETLDSSSSFFVPVKLPSLANDGSGATIPVHFTPIHAVTLQDVSIAYLATGNNLYTYGPTFNKQLMIRGHGLPENNTLHLGLKVNAALSHLQPFSLCFDTRNLELQLSQQLYQLLPLAKVAVNGQALSVTPGIPDSNTEETGRPQEPVFMEYDLLPLIEKDIRHYYTSRYLTIDRLEVPPGNGLFPASFQQSFPVTELQKITDKLLWITIVFPAAVRQDLLDELYVYPNAFPVINKRSFELKHRLKGGSHIIPLKTRDHEHFLAIKTLSDESHAFRSVPYRKMEEEQMGTYTLRTGGVERFDTRNAREMISYLLELLRSESAAFAGLGYDFIATTLKEMNQKIQIMQQKMQGNSAAGTELPHYLVVKPFEDSDVMYVEYWTTLAETANNLRAGTRLQLEKGVKVRPDNLVLVTTTVGGKHRLRPEERVNAFRYGIMSRDRIVTKEDIRHFCFYELGDRLKAVRVEKGIEMDPGPQQSFRRTIDVLLTPTNQHTLLEKDWDLLREQLRTKLQTRSGTSNYYRVLLQA